MKLSAIIDDDIFISYSRSDATTYTDGLAAALTKMGFSCFTDAMGTDAGRDLPATLIQKLRQCRMMVLIGSADAADSEAVGREIELFSAAKGTSSIVVIDIDGSVDNAFWKELVIGLRKEKESLEAFRTGNPTASVISRIEKAFVYRKLKDRLKRYTRYTVAVLAVLIVASIGAAVVASRQFSKAKLQQEIAASLDLANQSQRLIREPEQIAVSVEKAIEAVSLDLQAGLHSLVSDNALRESLALLPVLKQLVDYPGKRLLLSTTGDLIEISSKDTILEFSAPAQVKYFTRSGSKSPFYNILSDPYAEFAVSKGGNYVASGFGQSVILANTLDGKEKNHTISDEDLSVKLLAVSSDAKYVAIVLRGNDAGDFDGIELWDTIKDTAIDIPFQSINVDAISFSYNNAVLAAAGMSYDVRGKQTGLALLWDLSFTEGKQLDPANFNVPSRKSFDAEVSGIAPAGDDDRFASAQNSTITVWERGAGNEYFASCYVPVKSPSYDFRFPDSSTDLRVLRSSRPDAPDTMDIEEIWAARGFRESYRWVLPSQPKFIAFDAESGGVVALNETDSGQRLFYLSGTRRDPRSVAAFDSQNAEYFGPGLNFFVTSSDRIYVRDGAHLKYVADYSKVPDASSGFNLSANGNYLSFIRQNTDRIAFACSIEKLTDTVYRPYSSFPVHFGPQAIELANSGNLAYELSFSDSLFIWDITSAQAKLVSGLGFAKGISSFKVNGSDDLACLVEKIDESPAFPKCNIDILEIKTGKLKTLLKNIAIPNNYIWTPDGKFVLLCYADKIQAFAAASGEEVLDVFNASAVTSMAISKSGKFIAAGTHNGAIRIFEMSSVAEVSRINLNGEVTGLAFSDDDGFLYAHANSRTFLDLNSDNNFVIYAWSLSQRVLIDEAKGRIESFKK
jgi:WD40 repeat protein